MGRDICDGLDDYVSIPTCYLGRGIYRLGACIWGPIVRLANAHVPKSPKSNFNLCHSSLCTRRLSRPGDGPKF